MRAAGTLNLMFPWPDCVIAAFIFFLAIGISWICYSADRYDREHYCHSKSKYVYAAFILGATLINITSLSWCCYNILLWDYKNAIWIGTPPEFDILGTALLCILGAGALTLGAQLLTHAAATKHYFKNEEEICRYLGDIK